MLSDYLPAFDPYNLMEYCRKNREGADFIFIFDETRNNFVYTWRTDLLLKVGNDLKISDWHGYFCVNLLRDWWLCCAKEAKSMFLHPELKLLEKKAIYRSMFPAKYPAGSWIIAMETQPLDLGDDRLKDKFVTINRGRRMMPFTDQPCIWQPEFLTADGTPLEWETKKLINGARKRFSKMKLGYFSLSKKEKDVFRSMVHGLELPKEIAEALSVNSPETIKKHSKNIFTKGKGISKYFVKARQIALYFKDMNLMD